MTSKPTIKGVADEAEFQLVVARENLQWLAALARAIAREAKGDDRDTKVLVGLVNYLDDTGFSGIDQAIDNFKSASVEYATQTAHNPNVARHSEVAP
ncbi:MULTISPECIES: hypothetical protein [unclassified Pseudomonas]|nr:MULTISPECIES: hypothetical protein [unclassified Pseudomonas]